MKFCSRYYLSYLCEKYCVMDFLYELFLKLLAWIIIIAVVSMPISIIIKYLKDEFNEFKFSKNDISSNEDFDNVFNKWEKILKIIKGINLNSEPISFCIYLRLC